MIREYLTNDFDEINRIGSLIKDDFNNIYDIANFVNYDYGKIFVYTVESKIVGFIQIEIHFEDIDIINIAVDKGYQNKGIATSLITHIANNIPGDFIKLEVKASNISAIKTYEKNGFKEIHRRKKYYGEEDAIIMERKLVWKMS